MKSLREFLIGVSQRPLQTMRRPCIQMQRVDLEGDVWKSRRDYALLDLYCNLKKERNMEIIVAETNVKSLIISQRVIRVILKRMFQNYIFKKCFLVTDNRLTK